MAAPGTLLLLAVTVLLGAGLAIQAPANAMFGRLIGSPLAAGAVSLVVSTTLGIAALLLSGSRPVWGAAPWPLFLVGGVIGVCVVVGGIILVPRLGSAAFLASLVAGQLLTALALDHFGAFGLAPQEISLGRILGVGCIFGGIALIRLT